MCIHIGRRKAAGRPPSKRGASRRSRPDAPVGIFGEIGRGDFQRLVNPKESLP